MRITELLSNKGIELGAKVNSKDKVIKILVGLHNKVGNITDKDEFEKGIREREASSSTAVGDGIAIPHTKNKAVKKAGLVAMTVPDLLAKEADFFSIGTNDLTGYTMAVDRGNSKVSYLYSSYNPAVIRSIRRIIKAAKDEGIKVGMCGEACNVADKVMKLSTEKEIFDLLKTTLRI